MILRPTEKVLYDYCVAAHKVGDYIAPDFENYQRLICKKSFYNALANLTERGILKVIWRGSPGKAGSRSVYQIMKKPW